ncbi:NAD(P)/FAD-dependent oxidoreductase [Falsigemmobacter intermedius]|uniref:FAD-binding oxidoreductase n=1 Tax=Falsigemmobacter intermedius TaxID=1553448 RepID=A0A3S3WQ76_9RHOB|nr:FAD-binding oxidoreductase [Falsigemmobacter intermedius]RWY42225.1 FAD-binding oxidoreductase [Falsigemmobacter intermedius]
MNLLYANDRPGHYPASYYAATAVEPPPVEMLQGELRADVCIIGAGYTGLSAALHLAERGRKVVVLEAHRAGWGASGRNGGQVGSGQRRDQDWIEGRFSREDAGRLWQIAEEAKSLVRDLAAEMPGVDWRAGVAHACRQPSEVREAAEYAEKLNRDYGYEAIRPLDRLEMAELLGTPAYAGGDLDMGAGHMHPLNFALGLAKRAQAAGAVIYQQSPVERVVEGPMAEVITRSGRVRAEQVIFACNGYLGGLEPEVAARVMPINNFIIATEPLGDLSPLRREIAVADSRFVVNYWRRTAEGRLLFGGGESYGYKFPDLIRTVTRPMLEVYPQLRDVKIDYAWGGTLAITATRCPLFRNLRPGIWSASGYSGHGVAMATMAGRILSEALIGESERFDLMARFPVPKFPGGQMTRQPILALAMTWYALRDRLGL